MLRGYDVMPDVFGKMKRSEVMSRIRGTGNKDTELRLIQVFRVNGITGWRRAAPATRQARLRFPEAQDRRLRRRLLLARLPQARHLAPDPRRLLAEARSRATGPATER